ncbi:MAG: DegT/DnrJ/EryC1/StrS family aminotransferase [Verrucomicrobiales bacterium]|nr:DegT/DnrJ/EryC1/StrS family aminotransferase [Verrucomicrobiales bacterium]
MTVPSLDLKAQHLALEAELTAAFRRVLHSGQYILGREVEALEQQLADYLDVRHAIAVSSGTDALLLALMALEIGPGDEVICPAFTFFATAGCIARVGATPVFADSCPICFNLNSSDAATRVTSKTKAVIPVHLFGQPSAMDSVADLAQHHGLAIIEDAAQAFGAKYKGRFAGTIGTFGAFSFFPSKNLGCLGDGGLLVTNNSDLAERAQLLRNHGAKPKYFHKYIGGNFRMDALQAALLQAKLPYLDSYIEARRNHAAYYTDRLGKLARVAVARVEDCFCNGKAASNAQVPGDTLAWLPAALPQNRHIWNQYTLRITQAKGRNKLKDFLTSRSIGSEIYYPIPLHRQECFAAMAREACLPVAEQLAAESLSIPIFPEMTSTQQNTVISAIGEFMRN